MPSTHEEEEGKKTQEGSYNHLSESDDSNKKSKLEDESVNLCFMAMNDSKE